MADLLRETGADLKGGKRNLVVAELPMP